MFEPRSCITHSDLYQRLRVVAEKYGVPAADSFLAEVALTLPSEAYDKNEPHDVTLIMGELLNDNEGENVGTKICSEILDDMWSFHYYNPVEKPLKILMSSTGGSVDAAGAIIGAINQIRRDGRQVHCHVSGYAHSAAFDIVQYCDRRTAEPISSFMTHAEEWSKDGENAFSRIRDGIASRKLMAVIYEHISQRTGRSVDYYLKKIKDKDWYLTAVEALEEGLLDEIVTFPAFAKTPYKRAPRAVKPATTKATKVQEQEEEAA